MRFFPLLFLFLSACRGLPLDSGAFASEAGQSTLVLGSCRGDFDMGWSNCLVEKGSEIPALKFLMMNEGEWAVSDCALGLYKTGAAKGAEIVEVDLQGLSDQANRLGFCVLKIETIERYPDPKAKIPHSIPIRGGFFIEMIQPGYMPTPAPKNIAFCVKAYRTTKGRTVIQHCTE